MTHLLLQKIRLLPAAAAICLMLFAQTLVAQVPAPPTPYEGATLSVLNQGVVGSDFYFDLYLRATTDVPGNLYLANADFIFTFNNANFSSPVLSLVPSTCNFIPNNIGSTGLCQSLYESNLDVSIAGNQLRINLNTVLATNQTNLDNNIANITTTIGAHRLGRFKVSGISNPGGTAGLQWKTATPGVFTDVYYYATDFQQYRAALTYETPQNAALPLELVQFDAKAQQNLIALAWQSAQELHFEGYELQRSTDGTIFEKIAWMPGKGAATNVYAYQDRNVTPGILYYYRLKMLDNDATFSYSTVRSARLEYEWEKPGIQPNPTTGYSKLTFSAPMEGVGSLKIVDVSGKTITTQNIHFAKGANVLDLQVQNLAAGTYFVQLQVEETKALWTARLVIAR